MVSLANCPIYLEPLATAAAKAIGTTQGLVSMVCRGERGQTKGVRFALLADYKSGTVPSFTSAIKGKQHHLARSVRCVDNGVIYPTLTEAANAVGISSSKITMVCRGKRKSAGGLRWEYVVDQA